MCCTRVACRRHNHCMMKMYSGVVTVIQYLNMTAATGGVRIHFDCDNINASSVIGSCMQDNCSMQWQVLHHVLSEAGSNCTSLNACHPF